MISIFLLSFVISLTIPFLYFYSFYYLLVAEIIPRDQRYIPKPNVGDNILVYGVWVQDNELSSLLGKNSGWHEIHPVRYVKINGVEYGSMSYDNKYLFEDVYDPERLVVLDKHSPYRIASGKVMDVFKNTDGDYHVHILVDNEYRNLLKVDFVVIPYAWLLRIISFVLPLSIIIAYVIISTIKPRYTAIGRYTLKKFKSSDKTKT